MCNAVYNVTENKVGPALLTGAEHVKDVGCKCMIISNRVSQIIPLMYCFRISVFNIIRSFHDSPLAGAAAGVLWPPHESSARRGSPGLGRCSDGMLPVPFTPWAIVCILYIVFSEVNLYQSSDCASMITLG